MSKKEQHQLSGDAVTSKKSQRRALLGAISAAGVAGATKLPDQWKHPVINHVLLPAHAQTTDECIVTCTFADALMDVDLTVSSSSCGMTVHQSVYYGYEACSDSFGGFSSTYSCSTVWTQILPSLSSSNYTTGTIYSGSTSSATQIDTCIQAT